MATQKETPRYSFIYNALVEGPDDFIGLVAYSIYKKEKIAYVRRFEEKNGRSPEPSELQDFHGQAHGRLEQYKELATAHVADFYDSIYKAQSESLEQEYHQKLKDDLKQARTSWFAGVCQSLIGSFLYSILIGVIAVLLLYSQFGFEWMVQKIAAAQSALSSLQQ